MTEFNESSSMSNAGIISAVGIALYLISISEILILPGVELQTAIGIITFPAPLEGIKEFSSSAKLLLGFLSTFAV